MDISSLLESKNPNQSFAAKPLVRKWEGTGLLEGLRTETEKAGMAQLLEKKLHKPEPQKVLKNGQGLLFH
jgi:hypothetical protein